MNDIIEDIEILSNAVIAFQEGASDEKRMALNNLERLLERKKTAFENFETQMDMEFSLDTDI